MVHTARHEKFAVHTGEVAVEVLGTCFNVWKRGKKTKVVLSTGKVKLDLENSSEAVLMQPGDLVELEQGRTKIAHRIKSGSFTRSRT